MKVRLSVLPVMLALPQISWAAQSSVPEEIVITGEASMRERVLAAEVRAYDAFNKFNDDERFEISCSRQKGTGTVFIKQVCMPAFKLDALKMQADDFKTSLGNFLDPNGLPDGSVAPMHAPAEALIAGQQPEYQRKLKEVAEQHPEFLEALIEYSELKQQYQGTSD